MGFICPGGREMFSPIQFFTLAAESLLQQILLLLIMMSLITENNCRSSPAIVLTQRSAWVAFPAIISYVYITKEPVKLSTAASNDNAAFGFLTELVIYDNFHEDIPPSNVLP